jgi:hypothetical protein
MPLFDSPFQSEEHFVSYFRKTNSLSAAVNAIAHDWPSYRSVSIYARARRSVTSTAGGICLRFAFGVVSDSLSPCSLAASLGLKYHGGQLSIRGVLQPLPPYFALSSSVDSPLSSVLPTFRPAGASAISSTMSSSTPGRGHRQRTAGRFDLDSSGSAETESDAPEGHKAEVIAPTAITPAVVQATVTAATVGSHLRVTVSNDQPALKAPEPVTLPNGSPSAPLQSHLSFPITPQPMEQ